MKRTSFAAVAYLAMLAVPATGWPKGVTTGIDIDGDYLAASIEITDPEIVGRFSIWNGPGVGTYSHGKQDPPAWADPTKTEGRFIDWPRGWARERPSGLQRLEVTFYIGGREAEGQPTDYTHAAKYVFLYEIDASGRQGYVYLPQWKNEVVLHFVEGNWFYASKAWDELMMPLVAQNSMSDTADRRELTCKIATASIDADGGIWLYRSNREARTRLDEASRAYPSFRALTGDAAPGEEIDISCWPERT